MAGDTVEGILFDESTNVAIRESLPEASIAFFELVTHLGDGAVLIALATLLYWFGDESRREKRALVIAIGVVALAVSAGMKGLFLEPRPELAGNYGGYSFPSAHAMGAAAFYGAIAVVADTGTRRLRYALAGTVVFLVAASRVVIGVHFVGDVLVGVLLGLALVAVFTRDSVDPGTVFTAAGIIAVAAFALGSREFTTMTIGSALGAAVAWRYVASRTATPCGAAIVVLGVVALPVLVAVRAIAGTVAPPSHWSLETVGYAVATGGILVVPAVAERLNDRPTVRWLQRRLPFTGRTVDRDQLPIGRTGK